MIVLTNDKLVLDNLDKSNLLFTQAHVYEDEEDDTFDCVEHIEDENYQCVNVEMTDTDEALPSTNSSHGRLQYDGFVVSNHSPDPCLSSDLAVGLNTCSFCSKFEHICLLHS